MAETLITLSIIGIIAAMTIPTLMNRYTNHVYLVGLKKAYSNLTNAVKMMYVTENCSPGDFECVGWDDSGVSDTEGNKSFNIDDKVFTSISQKQTYMLSKHFNTIVSCLEANGLECLPEKFYSNVNNTSEVNLTNNNSAFQTQDGSTYMVNNGIITVDVNGKKAPNTYGKDVYMFKVSTEEKNGIKPGLVLPIGSKAFADYENDEELYWDKSHLCTMVKLDGSFCTGKALELDKISFE